MEASEYPTLDEKNLIQLTLKQQVMVAIEGSPVLTSIFVLWFFGVLGTMIAPHLDGVPRIVGLAITFVVFTLSGGLFYRLLKNGYLEKNRYGTERHFLRRMGVEKPMRFLREHPLHLAAYEELSEDMKGSSLAKYTRDGIRTLFLPAMLVFTGPDRYTSGPLIMSIMEEREITDVPSIAAILKEVEHNPPVLNEGAL